MKEREQRDGEVKGWEKEKKRWKAFKTELETEVRACAAAAQETALTLVKCIAPLTRCNLQVANTKLKMAELEDELQSLKQRK